MFYVLFFVVILVLLLLSALFMEFGARCALGIGEDQSFPSHVLMRYNNKVNYVHNIHSTHKVTFYSDKTKEP